ncbi:E3 ubiquitin-protein ligase rnf168-like isoform X1 [Carcharodon carcharias]|uniref:E3 ubiquitin-protein ligase rnf168-like isoform X1 n=1 Tax=Carcharodon carcharias TaxID=13397 RepID=UPI001B7DD614|nr:E3 ubiquitin-protein ligase rnf168-like isoform X1 [Carcharodon carcharias]
MRRKRRSDLAEPEAPLRAPPPPPALGLAECLCPVCQELLAEPVTPPCGHSLCLGCFQQTVEISNLNCPLCRRRLSNWARTKARLGSLVNKELQEQIRQQFPQLRSEEPSDGEVDRLHSRPQLSKPGEVRQEYEEQISKLKAERHAREEEELRASENLIQKILAEEKEQLIYKEQQRKEVDEQLKRDEKLAKMLSEEANSVSKTFPENLNIRPRRTASKSNCSSVSRGIKLTTHSPSHTGDIQKYLSPTSRKYQVVETPRQRSDASATNSKSTDADDISNSDSTEDISPFHYEEEQEQVCIPAQPELAQYMEGTPTATITDYQQGGKEAGEHSPGDDENEMVGVCSGLWKGRERCKEDVPLTELKLNSINSNGEDEGFSSLPILGHKLDYAHNSANICDLDNIDCATKHTDENIALKQKPSQDQGTKHQMLNQTPIQLKMVVKRKTWNSPEAEGETCSTVKKRKICPNEPCESIEPSSGIFHEEQHSDWEKKQSEKLRIEEQDRLLALRIQRKLDKEMLTVNRKRGSPDEYLLRTNKSLPVNCKKRVYAKNQTSVGTQKGSQTSRKSPRSQSRRSALGNKQRVLTDSSFTTSKRGSRIWQHPADQVKSQRTLHQGPLNCMDANSAALIPFNELRNSKKQQTIIEMFQKNGTN